MARLPVEDDQPMNRYEVHGKDSRSHSSTVCHIDTSVKMERHQILMELFGGNFIEKHGHWRIPTDEDTTPSHFERCRELSEDWNSRPHTGFFALCQRGLPPQYRWDFWKNRIMSLDHFKRQYDKNYYQDCQNKEHAWRELIKIDAPRTFPDVAIFNSDGQQMLKNILNAICIAEPDVGYCQGMNFVVAFILMVAGLDPEQEEDCFWFFLCLLNTYEIKGFYREKFPMLRRYSKGFDILMDRRFPEVADHLRHHVVDTTMFIHQWFLTLFVGAFPYAITAMMWDFFLATGTDGMLLLAFSVMKLIHPTLKAHNDLEDIVRFLRNLKDSAGLQNDLIIGSLILRNARKILTTNGIDVDIYALIRVPEAQLDADVLNDEARERKAQEARIAATAAAASSLHRPIHNNSMSSKPPPQKAMPSNAYPHRTPMGRHRRQTHDAEGLRKGGNVPVQTDVPVQRSLAPRPGMDEMK